MTSTADSEVLELKFWLMNWLNALNGMSGNGFSTGEADVMGSMAKAKTHRSRGETIEVSAENNPWIIVNIHIVLGLKMRNKELSHIIPYIILTLTF